MQYNIKVILHDFCKNNLMVILHKMGAISGIKSNYLYTMIKSNKLYFMGMKHV